jgi:hypothetical protein
VKLASDSWNTMEREMREGRRTCMFR